MLVGQKNNNSFLKEVTVILYLCKSVYEPEQIRYIKMLQIPQSLGQLAHRWRSSWTVIIFDQASGYLPGRRASLPFGHDKIILLGKKRHTCVSGSWRRNSVVRTSVCGWRTFPDLRLIHSWHVTTSWVKCPLWVNQLGRFSLPSLRDR